MPPPAHILHPPTTKPTILEERVECGEKAVYGKEYAASPPSRHELASQAGDSAETLLSNVICATPVNARDDDMMVAALAAHKSERPAGDSAETLPSNHDDSHVLRNVIPPPVPLRHRLASQAGDSTELSNRSCMSSLSKSPVVFHDYDPCTTHRLESHAGSLPN